MSHLLSVISQPFWLTCLQGRLACCQGGRWRGQKELQNHVYFAGGVGVSSSIWGSYKASIHYQSVKYITTTTNIIITKAHPHTELKMPLFPQSFQGSHLISIVNKLLSLRLVFHRLSQIMGFRECCRQQGQRRHICSHIMLIIIILCPRDTSWTVI